MRIYLDLVILINGWIMFFSSLSVGLLRSQNISKARLFLGVIVLTCYSLSIYCSRWQWIWYMIAVCISMMIYRIRPWFTSVILFIVIHTTYLYSIYFVSPECYIRHHVFLVPTTFSWLVSFFFGSFVIVLYVHYFHQLSKRIRTDGYRCHIWLKNKTKLYEFNAYYDSGNQAEFDGLPIIFLKNDCLATDSVVEIERLCGNELVNLLPVEISFDGKHWQWVYAGKMQNFDMQNVDVLLNVHTTGG